MGVDDISIYSIVLTTLLIPGCRCNTYSVSRSRVATTRETGTATEIAAGATRTGTPTTVVTIQFDNELVADFTKRKTQLFRNLNTRAV